MNEGISKDSLYVSTKWGLSVMFLVVGLFHIISRLINYFCVPFFIQKKGENEIWKWCNLLTSWVHALIVGSWDLLCFYYYPELLDDLIDFKNTFCYYLVVFSTGYFVYDFCDMIVNKKIFKMWELTLHHIAVTSMFFYNMVCLKCIGYNVVALLCEVNSFFLHTRKLLQMIKMPFNHWFYRSTAIVNITTFALFRGYSLFKITQGIFNDKVRVDTPYYLCLCFSMTIMNLLNPVLFWILLNNDFLRHNKNVCDKAVSNGDVCSKSLSNGFKSSSVMNEDERGRWRPETNGPTNSHTESPLASFKERARKLTDQTMSIDEYKIE